MAKRRRLNRTLVVEQAAAMVDEGGVGTAVALSDLARTLDVRTPSLYNHINGQDDLQHALAVYSVQRLLDTLRAAVVGRSGRAALISIAHAYRGFVHAHPGTYPLTVRAPEPDDTELATLSQEIVQLLLLVMASIGLTGDDATHAIRGLRAVLHGFTSLEAADGFKMPLNTDESFQRLLDAYLNGID